MDVSFDDGRTRCVEATEPEKTALRGALERAGVLAGQPA